MKRLARFAILFLILLSFLATDASAANKKSLLKGVGKKKTKTPSMSLLLREDLKAEFKKAFSAYLQENMDDFMAFFDDSFYLNGRFGKRGKVTPKYLQPKIARDFKQNDMKKVPISDVFDMASPSMTFVLSEEQICETIPVWNFSISAKEIRPLMKKGDYLVIANTLPAAMDHVPLPMTVYVVFRKIEGEFYITAIYM